VSSWSFARISLRPSPWGEFSSINARREPEARRTVRFMVSQLALGSVIAAVVSLLPWFKKVRNNIAHLDCPFPSLSQYFNWFTIRIRRPSRGQATCIVVAVVVVLVVLVYSRHCGRDGDACPASAGALGNLVDRLTQDGLVTDFLLFTLPVGERSTSGLHGYR
jgi:lipoprotein signal peptidase